MGRCVLNQTNVHEEKVRETSYNHIKTTEITIRQSLLLGINEMNLNICTWKSQIKGLQ